MKLNKKIKVLSLFDGISCARVALDRAGVPVGDYYASEIDKYAIQISKNRWPDIQQLGDVKNIHGTTESWIKNARDGRLLKGTGKDFDIKIDLLIGGSPCQDLSIAGKRKGLAGERSGLFYDFLRIRDEVKPKYFILENVNSMPKEARDTISRELGVDPIMINAALVSAQTRKRLFWVGKFKQQTNGWIYEQVHIELPKDREIYLKDIIENGVVDKDKSYCIDYNYFKGINRGSKGGKASWKKGKRQIVFNLPVYGGFNDMYENIRKLTPIECERLQGLPDGYTEGVSNTQRYKACGNAFNVDVVSHIIEQIMMPRRAE